MAQRRELRVFVSSTFRDLHEERDILVRRVFPEIRALCRRRGILFTDIDLRWGLTDEELALGKVIRACLDEVDRCRPYFIGITGDSYGYIPPLTELYMDPDLIEHYPWLVQAAHEESSIMDMEFRHAALNDPAAAGESVAFFFRRSDDAPSDPEAYRRLQHLKDRVRAAGFHPQSFREAGTLAEMVRDYLLRIIEQDYPDVRPPTPLEQIRWEHEAFALSRRQAYIPHPSYLARLDTFADSQDPPLVLYGQSGSGKSALLAYWAHQWQRRHPQAFIIEHYVGIGAGTTDQWEVMRHIILAIKDRYGVARDLPATPDSLEHAFPEWLAEVQKESLVLIIDGLNQIEDAAYRLQWLPSFIPPRVRLILSTTREEHLVTAQQRGWQQMKMQPLTEPERRAIIVRFLAERRKALGREQIEQLARDPKCSHPLFLRTVLEELQVFGIHEQLDAKLDEYLSTTGIEDLFQRVLERLEEDFSAGSLRQLLSLIWASRDGMSPLELTEITRLSRLKLTTMRAALDYHLIEREGRWGFFHDFLRQAVEKRYCANLPEQQRLHRQLGQYFQEQPMSARVARELPWQWERAADLARWLSVLSSVELLVELAAHGGTFDLLGYWIRSGHQAEMAERYRAALGAYGATHTAEEHAAAALTMCQYCYDTAEYRFGEECGREAVSLYCSIYGEDNQLTASSLNDLAVVLDITGRYEESEKLYRRALTIREHTLGPEHQDTVLSMNNLAGIMYATGKYREAEELLQRALTICECTLGMDHPSTALSLNNLAIVLDATKRYEESEKLHRRALALRERILGTDHPHTALSLNNLAIVLDATGRYAEAEELLRRALAIQERTLGSEHLYTAFSQNNLANALVASGQYAEAEELLQHALAIQERALGTDHPDIATSLNNLASILRATGRYEEAEKIYRHVLAIRVHTLGADHAWTLTTQARLAETLAAAGHGQDALLLLESFDALEERCAPIPDDARLLVLYTRALLALDAGQLDTANTALDHAEAICTATTRREREYRYWELRGDCAVAAGDPHMAADFYQRALEILYRFNPAHPLAASINERLHTIG
ncbi:MAG: tetratricopeptide repeat protein [Chlorobi bacterium]|nr:tetratricopeptide repeat protein [Chlorobiota bacterium]